MSEMPSQVNLEDTFDVAIIGGGPAGSTAAIYAARARLNTLVLDKANLGGSLSQTAHIANYPALGYEEPLSGAELLQRMHDHATSLGAAFLQTQVFGLSLEEEIKEIYTAEGTVKARAVILATGIGARANKLEGEERLLGRGVSYCATCDAAFYGGKTAALLGSSTEAVEEALALARFAAQVYLLVPGGKLTAEAELLEQLEQTANIEVRYRQRVEAIEGEETVTGLRIRTGEGEEHLPVAGVFIYLPGNKPATELFQGAVELDADGYIVTDGHWQTSVAGVFACGDARNREVKQVIVAGAEGCLALLSADRYLNKRSQMQVQR